MYNCYSEPPCKQTFSLQTKPEVPERNLKSQNEPTAFEMNPKPRKIRCRQPQKGTFLRKNFVVGRKCSTQKCHPYINVASVKELSI